MWTVMLALATQVAPAPMAGMATDMAPPRTDCPATPAPLPAALVGWSRAVPVGAGADADHAATLAIGTGARATLLPTAGVRFPLAPAKAGAPSGRGGVFAFAVPAAGRYRVALGAGAWIDVVRDGRFVASVAHGHGPDCTGVRKTVDFDLAPGRYLLQVSGSAAPALPLMVARP